MHHGSDSTEPKTKAGTEHGSFLEGAHEGREAILCTGRRVELFMGETRDRVGRACGQKHHVLKFEFEID